MYISHSAAAVTGLLGIRERRGSTMSLIDRVEQGLPVGALDRLATLLAPGDSSFKHRIVPRATLSRRQKTGALSSEESGRVVRLARLWSQAMDLWKDDEDARGFLFERHPLMDRRRPIDVAIATELGTEMISDLLGRLKYGTAL